MSNISLCLDVENKRAAVITAHFRSFRFRNCCNNDLLLVLGVMSKLVLFLSVPVRVGFWLLLAVRSRWGAGGFSHNPVLFLLLWESSLSCPMSCVLFPSCFSCSLYPLQPDHGMGRESHWDPFRGDGTPRRSFHAQASSATEVSVWEKRQGGLSLTRAAPWVWSSRSLQSTRYVSVYTGKVPGTQGKFLLEFREALPAYWFFWAKCWHN